MIICYLHYYESRWICLLRKSDIRRGGTFANVFRFIDDLTAINDAGVPEKKYIDCSTGLFLDLRMKKVIFSFMIKEMISHFQ